MRAPALNTITYLQYEYEQPRRHASGTFRSASDLSRNYYNKEPSIIYFGPWLVLLSQVEDAAQQFTRYSMCMPAMFSIGSLLTPQLLSVVSFGILFHGGLSASVTSREYPSTYLASSSSTGGWSSISTHHRKIYWIFRISQ